MKYRKKPVVVEAHQWHRNGDHPEDYVDTRAPDPTGVNPVLMVRTVTAQEQRERGIEGKVVRYFRHPDVPGYKLCQHCKNPMYAHGWIDTLEGGHIVCPGDYIITGVLGEHYPCKPDIFHASYEPANEPKP